MSNAKFKVGEVVILSDKLKNQGFGCGWVNSMDGLVGERVTIASVDTSRGLQPPSYHIREDNGTWAYAEPWFRATGRSLLTREEREIARKEADLQALKERAALKAQQAAERKAKAERVKLMRGLSPAGRRVVELLKAKPDLLGCQTKNAAELASAITGDDAEKIRKALA